MREDTAVPIAPSLRAAHTMLGAALPTDLRTRADIGAYRAVAATRGTTRPQRHSPAATGTCAWAASS
ncbi:hypothetical protein [Microbacterium invictum]|uniref:Uncharacterized protein n=1 Tax=Microbacterium invictum TaxID=515415 RepID=A0AA40SRZ4_9MICO|nr:MULTISPECIES: hypothetical protein [Microbacterium]MBB4141350.1 hypothetical protein [Microbacterium invictum]